MEAVLSIKHKHQATMKKHILSIASLLAALVLSSCFQQETTIHLKKDGSGTILEEVRLGKQMLAMPAEDLKGMLIQAEEQAKQRSTKLGEGVTFVKFEKVSEGASKGWRTTYQFTDINKLRITKAPEMESPGEKPKETKPEDLIVFNYKDGVLKIQPNMDKEGDKPAPQGDTKLPADITGPMESMLAELKLGIRLVADSGIAETNATHRKGDTITLMEVDMQEVMKKPENRKKMGGLDDKSAALQSLKGIDGVKMETKPEVTVKLK